MTKLQLTPPFALLCACMACGQAHAQFPAALVLDIQPGATGSSPTFLTDVEGTIYFQANDGVHGPEPWKSDGAAGGTVLVKDINPGSASAFLGHLFAFRRRLWFKAGEPQHGDELWSSDGTVAGTQMIRDIEPGV